MPVVSAIDAVNQRYATLTLSPLPVLWFNKAQLVVPSGANATFPIVRLTDNNGGGPNTLEGQATQVDDFTIEVFTENLSSTRTTLEAIIWNGAAPGTFGGFWFPLTFPNPTGWTFLACNPQDKPVYDTVTDPRAPSAAQLHRGVFRFSTMFLRG